MTIARKLKRHIRSEMERTGESYQAVLNRVRAERPNVGVLLHPQFGGNPFAASTREFEEDLRKQAEALNDELVKKFGTGRA